jgi:predicted kinase
MICGLPGAGKTTLARELAAASGAVRLCPDEWMDALSVSLFDEGFRARLEEVLLGLAEELVGHGASVILENGFWRVDERAAYRDRLRAVGAHVRLVVIDADLDLLARRLVERAAAGGPEITPAMLREYAAHFERPSDEEMGQFDGAELRVVGQGN